MSRFKVTQIKSGIGGKQNQRDTLRSLGLKRIGDDRKALRIGGKQPIEFAV